jgi:acetylornithine deacetylase
MASLPSTLDMIRALVASPSVSSHDEAFDQGNLEVIETLATWAEELGFQVQVMRLPHHRRKANLIATLGQGEGGLVLSGHTDTVPWDDGRWNHDPFGAQEHEGRVYGLGTADMKSFLALALEAASAFRADQLKAPVTLLATADEESTMAGARALLDAGLELGRYAVIGEPTNLRPIRAHKGIMMELVRILGRSGHSSDPALGVSALEGMHQAIGALLALRDRLQAEHSDPAFAVPTPTMNLGRIVGGDNANRICAACDLHLDLRFLPGMDMQSLRRELRQTLQLALGGSELRYAVEPLFGGVPALETPADARLVREAQALTGHQAGTVAFGTEGPFLAQMGMETLIMGPGSIDCAHQPDEHLELSQIAPTVTLLQSLIQRLCVEAEPSST